MCNNTSDWHPDWAICAKKDRQKLSQTSWIKMHSTLAIKCVKGQEVWTLLDGTVVSGCQELFRVSKGYKLLLTFHCLLQWAMTKDFKCSHQSQITCPSGKTFMDKIINCLCVEQIQFWGFIWDKKFRLILLLYKLNNPEGPSMRKEENILFNVLKSLNLLSPSAVLRYTWDTFIQI